MKLLKVLIIVLMMSTTIVNAQEVAFNKEIKREKICMAKDAEKVKEEQEKNELYKKYDSWLTGELKAQEEIFVDYSIELGIDPALPIAISLFETGNGTSDLVVNYHNFGGMKGYNDWMYFTSKEEGAKAFIDNLYNGYISKGADTPEKIATNYCGGSQHWIENVNWYINEINN